MPKFAEAIISPVGASQWWGEEPSEMSLLWWRYLAPTAFGDERPTLESIAAERGVPLARLREIEERALLRYFADHQVRDA